MKSLQTRIRTTVVKSRWSVLPALVMFLASGCVFKNPGYPQSWPQLTTANEIEKQIEGSFMCSGEDVLPEVWHDKIGRAKTLPEYLIGGKSPLFCEYIEIQFLAPDELVIRFMQMGSEAYKQIYKKSKDYEVEDKWIVLKSRGSWAAEDIVLAHESVSSYLTINVERDLVVKEKSSVAGTIMVVIPVGGSTTQWGRFKRKDERSGR
jgi:hypothetical protein